MGSYLLGGIAEGSDDSYIFLNFTFDWLPAGKDSKLLDEGIGLMLFYRASVFNYFPSSIETSFPILYNSLYAKATSLAFSIYPFNTSNLYPSVINHSHRYFQIAPNFSNLFTPICLNSYIFSFI